MVMANNRSDNQLVESRDMNALFRRYNDRLVTFLRSRERAVDADDIAQETWVKVVTRLDSFDPGRAAFSTWLFNIARNASIDAFRRNRTYRKHVVVSLAECGTHRDGGADL